MLLLQRLWSIAAAAETNGSAGQYQCLAPQYQSGACSDAPRPVVAPVTHRRARAHARTVASPAPRHDSLVLAAVATGEPRPAKTAVVLAPSSAGLPEQSRGTPEAAVQRREASASSDGWLLRALALVAVLLLSVLLTVSEVPAIGTTVAGVRARLSSKGLSSSRIDLRNTGGAPQRHGGISYRD